MKDTIKAILTVIMLVSIFILYSSLVTLAATFIIAESVLLGIAFIAVFTIIGAILSLEAIDKF